MKANLWFRSGSVLLSFTVVLMQASPQAIAFEAAMNPDRTGFQREKNAAENNEVEEEAPGIPPREPTAGFLDAPVLTKVLAGKKRKPETGHDGGAQPADEVQKVKVEARLLREIRFADGRVVFERRAREQTFLVVEARMESSRYQKVKAFKIRRLTLARVSDAKQHASFRLANGSNGRIESPGTEQENLSLHVRAYKPDGSAGPYGRLTRHQTYRLTRLEQGPALMLSEESLGSYNERTGEQNDSQMRRYFYTGNADPSKVVWKRYEGERTLVFTILDDPGRGKRYHLSIMTGNGEMVYSGNLKSVRYEFTDFGSLELLSRIEGEDSDQNLVVNIEPGNITVNAHEKSVSDKFDAIRTLIRPSVLETAIDEILPNGTVEIEHVRPSRRETEGEPGESENLNGPGSSSVMLNEPLPFQSLHASSLVSAGEPARQ